MCIKDIIKDINNMKNRNDLLVCSKNQNPLLDYSTTVQFRRCGNSNRGLKKWLQI